MSWLSELLSGGAGARRAALGRVARSTEQKFVGLGDRYMSDFQSVIDRFTRERGENLALYREEMGRAQSTYTQYFDQARSQYAAGMDKALAEMRTGRDATIELMRQQTLGQQRTATARSAFTGLGQTTFGQSQIANIGTQGMLREAALREQYSTQLSALEAQRASGMSTLTGQMAQGLGAMQQAQASGLSGMFQQYNAITAGAQQSALNNQYQLIQTGYLAGTRFRGEAAQLSGAAWQPLSSIFGSFAGGAAGGFAGTVGTNLGNAFVPPTA